MINYVASELAMWLLPAYSYKVNQRRNTSAENAVVIVCQFENKLELNRTRLNHVRSRKMNVILT